MSRECRRHAVTGHGWSQLRELLPVRQPATGEGLRTGELAYVKQCIRQVSFRRGHVCDRLQIAAMSGEPVFADLEAFQQ